MAHGDCGLIWRPVALARILQAAAPGLEPAGLRLRPGARRPPGLGLPGPSLGPRGLLPLGAPHCRRLCSSSVGTRPASLTWGACPQWRTEGKLGGFVLDSGIYLRARLLRLHRTVHMYTQDLSATALAFAPVGTVRT
jgi:hypothetical protein